LARRSASGPTPRTRDRRRLDEALVERGLAESRSRARALILAGDALVNGLPVTQAGAAVVPGDKLALKAPPRFVSRGGEKLAHALDAFDLDVAGLVAADFGASTGGFTDCLLQGGAARVYALDVGYGQLAQRLREDPRVVVMDRTNVRSLASLPEPVDLVTIDVSFIGLRLVLPAARDILGEDGCIVALVKPQFETGREEVGRGGVVRNPAAHRAVLAGIFATADDLGLGVRGLIASPLRGPAGNVEFLALLVPATPSILQAEAIDRALAEAPAA
jgi:23S rRNA (cytidine1920-2'-O)/16S rRNA (cytidine1409-2'-O)-methyltransferase